MATISDSNLAVFISLLAKELRSLTTEVQLGLAQTEDLTDDQAEDLMQAQMMQVQYTNILDGLRVQYELALKVTDHLPSYELLIKSLVGDPECSDAQAST
jgi:hypothetical protein